MTIAPSLFGLIARSPFRRIELHMELVSRCALLLRPFYKAIDSQDWEEVTSQHLLIRDLEEQADAQKKKIRLKLHKNLFLPVSRTDLLTLLTTQDNLANQTKDVTGLMLGRKMRYPKEIRKLMREFVEAVCLTVEQAHSTIGELNDLQESAFGGNVIHHAEAMIDQLDQLESKTDEIQIQIRQILFQVENEHSPVDVIFWYSSIEQMGEIADWAQRIGAKLLQILSH
jgi:predicted phosphate transport protein (TIGR00153 family)|tara:strand:+ start:1123 stop:1803 length:681 start_codon:yes stop_codon:yes gene_type:complete